MPYYNFPCIIFYLETQVKTFTYFFIITAKGQIPAILLTLTRLHSTIHALCIVLSHVDFASICRDSFFFSNNTASVNTRI